ncbi:MAG: YtxH domain-containing protein [Ignavibacteriae bacterium]|nr:YtxH domain-containing protein [Ignavibacteriota bacterium]
MAEERNGLAKGLFIGFVAGAIAGAITALLYSPKSGKEMRSDIKKKAGDLAEGASDYMKGVRSKTTELVNKGKERSEQLVGEVKEKAGHLLDDADKMLSDIRSRATEESGRVKSAFRAGVETYKTERERDKRSS